MRCIAAAAVVLLSLAARPAGADLGPKPIKDTGTWRDPGRLRLVDNDVEIRLGDQAAEVRACFLFVSPTEVAQWNRGDLIWTWPLPSGYPRPEQFKVAVATGSAQSSADAARWHRQEPCKIVNNRREIKELRVESFEQLGIGEWYVFGNDFLMIMPRTLLVVRAVVTYTQPYRRTAGGLGELLYVLRTGSLWAGTIERLRLSVQPTPGVDLASCNWVLDRGRAELTNVEPDKDLSLRVRRSSDRRPRDLMPVD